MSYSIFDSFLTIADCKYYCKQLASKLNVSYYDYFYDNRNKIQFPGDTDIYKFKDFRCLEAWRLKFNLTKPKTIMKLGLENYVSKNHELVFNLTVKGYSFTYVCHFSSSDNKDETINGVVDNKTNTIYIEEKDAGQLSWSL